MVFGQWPRRSSVPVVLGQAWSGILLRCRPATLIFYLVQVLTILQGRYLLLEAQCIDQGLLLLFDGVLVRAIKGRLFEAELVFLVFENLNRSVLLSMHHRRGDVSVETHGVCAVLAV